MKDTKQKAISLIPEVNTNSISTIISTRVTENSDSLSGKIQDEIVTEYANIIKVERKELATKALHIYDVLFNHERKERKSLKPLPTRVTTSGIELEAEYSKDHVDKLTSLVNDLNTLNSNVAKALDAKSSNKESWLVLEKTVNALTTTYSSILKK